MLKIYYFISTFIVLIYSFFFDKKKLRSVFMEDSDSLDELLKSKKSLIRWGDGESTIFFGGDLYFQPNSTSLFLSLRKIVKTYNKDSAYYIALPNAFLKTDKESLINQNKYHLWVHTRYLFSKYFEYKNMFFLSSFMFREESDLKNDVIEQLWKTETYIYFLHSNYKYYIDFCKKFPSKKVLFVEVSSANSYKQFKKTINTIRTNIFNEKISKKDLCVLVSAGPASKSIIYSLTKYNIRSLDMGHYFDYKFYEISRIKK